MYWCKELKLIYAATIMILQVNVNKGAAESKMSSVFSQNSDDFKSLELCTSRNQQRLGVVFGNYTRHHKKGHRRRTTTTAPTTILSTVVTEADIFTTTLLTTTDKTKFLAEHEKLPKPLRLSSSALNDDYSDDISSSVDNILEKTVLNERRHERHHDKVLDNKEILKQLNEEALSSNVHKVKKMYRDSSASAVNKLGSKTNKGGIFLTENCTTVVAQIGTTAILHCEVSDITENTVTWIRRKDYSLLSVGLVTYSADSRFFSAHGRHVKDWALHIRFATNADGGYYECQVPTHPPTSIFFKLVLVAAYAEIMGESEKIIHEGSMLRLVCVVKRSTEPPSYVFWYFENRMINYDLNGVSVHNGRQTSELVIGKAEPRHAGNYTCVPANAKAASVTVHVVQSETPAAMQHGNSSSSKLHMSMILVLAISIIMISHRKHNLNNFLEFG